MFEGLFGNSMIEKILFYLLKNKSTYPSELKRVFETHVSIIQKALERLEKNGIVVSNLIGKTRVYEFNPRYPFLKELIALFEKGYSFLPESIKRKYYEKIIRKRPRRKGKPLDAKN